MAWISLLLLLASQQVSFKQVVQNGIAYSHRGLNFIFHKNTVLCSTSHSHHTAPWGLPISRPALFPRPQASISLCHPCQHGVARRAVWFQGLWCHSDKSGLRWESMCLSSGSCTVTPAPLCACTACSQRSGRASWGGGWCGSSP